MYTHKKIMLLSMVVMTFLMPSSARAFTHGQLVGASMSVVATCAVINATYNFCLLRGINQRLEPAGLLYLANYIHNWKLDKWPTARSIKENSAEVARELRAAAVGGEMRVVLNAEEQIDHVVARAINAEIVNLERYKQYVYGCAHFAFGYRGASRNFERACLMYAQAYPDIQLAVNYPADWTAEQELFIDQMMEVQAQENDPYWIFPNYRFAVRTYWMVNKHIFRLRAMAAAVMAERPQEVVVYNR